MYISQHSYLPQFHTEKLLHKNRNQRTLETMRNILCTGIRKLLLVDKRVLVV